MPHTHKAEPTHAHHADPWFWIWPADAEVWDCSMAQVSMSTHRAHQLRGSNIQVLSRMHQAGLNSDAPLRHIR